MHGYRAIGDTHDKAQILGSQQTGAILTLLDLHRRIPQLRDEVVDAILQILGGALDKLLL